MLTPCSHSLLGFTSKQFQPNVIFETVKKITHYFYVCEFFPLIIKFVQQKDSTLTVVAVTFMKSMTCTAYKIYFLTTE